MKKRERKLNEITEFRAINSESSFNDLFILIDILIIIKEQIENSYEEQQAINNESLIIIYIYLY